MHLLGYAEHISHAGNRQQVAKKIALIKVGWTQERVKVQGKYWQADSVRRSRIRGQSAGSGEGAGS